MSDRMLPTDKLWIDVEILIDHTWWPGTLEHRRQNTAGGWEGFVRWSTRPGETRIGWYDYADLRPVESATCARRAPGTPSTVDTTDTLDSGKPRSDGG